MAQRNMIGKYYYRHRLGKVKVLTQPNYVKGAPRNVLIVTERGREITVPQRSLRKKPKARVGGNCFREWQDKCKHCKWEEFCWKMPRIRKEK